MDKKIVKVRVMGDINAVESLAALIGTMAEKSEVLRVTKESEIYPNRPPSKDGRIYIELEWTP